MEVEKDIVTLFAFILWGADWVLFIQGIYRAVLVFPNKTKKMFLLVLFGVVAAFSQSTFVMSVNFFDLNPKVYSIFGSLSWFGMIASATFAYAIY